MPPNPVLPQKKDWSNTLSKPRAEKEYLIKVKEADRSTGCFLSFTPAKSEETSSNTGVLQRIPVAVKDNIAVQGHPLTCGSKILENFVSPYTATAVSHLEQEGAFIVGKTNLDEFGMGSSSLHSALGKTVNPWDKSKVPGGSSCGSAAAVAAGLVPLSLGSDTGGSVRQPANFCGVYGLKPTYGAISRYGLTAYASSLEVIGSMSTDLELLRESFRIMAHPDSKDQSSSTSQTLEKSDVSNSRIMVLDVEEGVLDPAVERSYKNTVNVLKDSGCTVEKKSIDSLHLVVPSYYTIATAEASANLARYNGVRYGYSPDFAETPMELTRRTRCEGFGTEVKLRIMLGTYVLRSGFQDQYYGQAQRVRTLIRKELSELFSTFDLLLLPVFPSQAFSPEDDSMDDYKQRLADVFTCLANLTGFPALSVPTGLENALPAGVQFMAPHYAEERLFSIAETLADTFPLQTAPGALDIRSLS